MSSYFWSLPKTRVTCAGGIDRHLHARQPIAKLTAVDAPFVRIRRIARPEPMVRALVFVEDGLRPVGHELHSPCHNLTWSEQNRDASLCPQSLRVNESMLAGQAIL
jgi:hypothetical protein